MSTQTSSETLSTYWRRAVRKYTTKNLMDLQINLKDVNQNLKTTTLAHLQIRYKANQKKNIKPQKISKNKIKDMRKMTRFQRLKNRLDAINCVQRPEDSNNITKSSEVESDGRQTPFNNYTIKVKGEREEHKEMEQGNQHCESNTKFNNEEMNKIINQSSDDSQNRSSYDSSSDRSLNNSHNNSKKNLEEEMDGIVELPMSMKEISSPATSIKRSNNKASLKSKYFKKQKLVTKMNNFKSQDSDPPSQRKLEIDPLKTFSHGQLLEYSDIKMKINSPTFKRPERLLNPISEKLASSQIRSSEQKHQSLKKIYSNIPTDMLSKKELIAAHRNLHILPNDMRGYKLIKGGCLPDQSKPKYSNYQRVLNLNKGMQGTLSQQNTFNRRYRSPQYTSKNCIMLPSFDRGRRKISKMGGEQFSFSNTIPRIASASPQVEINNLKSRRFTSTSPATKNKMISNIIKTSTLNLDDNELLEKEFNDKTFDHRRFIEIIPEVQTYKAGGNENKRKYRQKAATKVSRYKRSEQSQTSSRLQKQSTHKSKDLK